MWRNKEWARTDKWAGRTEQRDWSRKKWQKHEKPGRNDDAALGNPDVDDDNPDVNDDVPIAVWKASNVRRVEIWFATKDF